MKRTLSLFFCVFTSIMAVADEPPCWCEFTIKSVNQQYFAKVSKDPADSLKKPWESDWTIQVYKVDKGDTTEQWKATYNYDGYSDGILSNDGQTFAYVNYWYYEKYPLVYIYHHGELTGRIAGKEFKVPKHQLKKTVSHQLWLSQTGKSYAFGERKNSHDLIVHTIDGKSHIIDCKTGTIK